MSEVRKYRDNLLLENADFALLPNDAMYDDQEVAFPGGEAAPKINSLAFQASTIYPLF